ncbi:hypothetical protein [Aquisphaera insulae]|uniref:hypothetical protein n=1 Tax=Aquisphaera insulae TaxID=2712864 RepID=UPI0013EC339E|nr:hypothetical protein [Aquisphaera insulae]
MVSRGWMTRDLLLLPILVFIGFVGLQGILSPAMTAGVFAFLFLEVLFLATIQTHRTTWNPMDPSLVPFDPEGPASQEELRSHFAETAADLERLGYSPERYYLMKQMSPNTQGSTLLFGDVHSGETARVQTVVATRGRFRVATSFVIFGSEFSDGTEVVTANMASPTTLPPRRPPFHGRTFPQVRDVDLLLDLHRARVANLAAGLTPVDPIGDDPDAYLRRVNCEAPYAHFIARGYMYADEMAGVYRITWKGAFLVTLVLLPPFKQIRLTWRRLEAARQIANLKAGRPVD